MVIEYTGQKHIREKKNRIPIEVYSFSTDIEVVGRTEPDGTRVPGLLRLLRDNEDNTLFPYTVTSACVKYRRADGSEVKKSCPLDYVEYTSKHVLKDSVKLWLFECIGHDNSKLVVRLWANADPATGMHILEVASYNDVQGRVDDFINGATYYPEDDYAQQGLDQYADQYDDGAGQYDDGNASYETPDGANGYDDQGYGQDGSYQQDAYAQQQPEDLGYAQPVPAGANQWDPGDVYEGQAYGPDGRPTSDSVAIQPVGMSVPQGGEAMGMGQVPTGGKPTSVGTEKKNRLGLYAVASLIYLVWYGAQAAFTQRYGGIPTALPLLVLMGMSALSLVGSFVGYARWRGDHSKGFGLSKVLLVMLTVVFVIELVAVVAIVTMVMTHTLPAPLQSLYDLV